MKQITEDYCSYETAKLLKEKGFKQDCDYATSWYAAEYYKNSAQGEWFEGEHEIIKDIDDKCTISYLFDKGVFIPAPTQSLALKWLREVHELHIDVFIGSDESYDADGVMVDEWHFWTYCITNTSGDMIYDAYSKVDVIEYQTHEQAIEAALLYVLKNLI